MDDGQLAQPEIRPGRSLYRSWVWVVPILALIVAISLVISAWSKNGPVITISFDSVSGIEVGQTKLRFRDVIVGEVIDIRVADDRRNVLVDVQLKRHGSEYITQADSKFWVVRPQVSMSGVSGLETLLSGAYISVDAPNSISDDKVYEFSGLEFPPEIIYGQKGSIYTLKTDSLGSLYVGAGVYYRRVEVGRVVAVNMSKDGRFVELQAFVESPYDKFVTPDTRFWNDSGIDMTLSTDGVQLRTAGLAALISGGIAFVQADEGSSFDGEYDSTPAKPGSVFTLFNTKTQALAEADVNPINIELRFMQSVRGLKNGAHVDFLGINVGEVIDYDLEYDASIKRFYTKVRAEIYPNRFSEKYLARAKKSNHPEAELANIIFDPLIKHGLRGQLRTASLLTGQQYLALDFFKEKDIEKTMNIDTDNQSGFIIPTVPSDNNKIQEQLSGIVEKINEIPMGELGTELVSTLKSFRALMDNLNQTTTKETNKTLSTIRKSLDNINKLLDSDAPFMGGFTNTMQNLDQAARALRLLADTLQTNPEIMLRGHARDVIH